MQEIAVLLGIGSAIALGAMSPGPSFVMVARKAVSASRAAGIYAALGMGAGGLFLRPPLCWGCRRCCWRFQHFFGP